MPVVVIEPDSSLLVGYKLDGTPCPAAGLLLARLSAVSQGLARDSGRGGESGRDSGSEAAATEEGSAGLLAGGTAGSAQRPCDGGAGGAHRSSSVGRGSGAGTRDSSPSDAAASGE